MQTPLPSRCDSSPHSTYSIRENELYASNSAPCNAGQRVWGVASAMEDKPGFWVGRAPPLQRNTSVEENTGFLHMSAGSACTHTHTGSQRCVVKHSWLGRYREPPGSRQRLQLIPAPHQPLHVIAKPCSSSRTQFCPVHRCTWC